MRRALHGLIAFSFLVLLTHCNGQDLGTADAAGDSESTAQDGDIVLEEPAALVRDPVSGTQVAANAGFAGNGTILSVPTGFTIDQCRFTASLAIYDGSALSAQVGVNDTTGEVVCRKVVQSRVEVPAEFEDCTASFTVICVK